MDETQKRLFTELQGRLTNNSDKSLPDNKNVPRLDVNDENEEKRDRIDLPPTEYRKGTAAENPKAENELEIARFRRMSLSRKDEIVSESKSLIGKFRRRTYSVMQNSGGTSTAENNNKPSFVGTKTSHENDQSDSGGKYDSLRNSLITSIKKVKDKLQDKRDVVVFKTYLGPEIIISDEEHRKAEERFNTCVQQERIFDSEKGGGHLFRVFSYTKYCSIIHRFRRTRMKAQIGDILYLCSDPLDIFTEAIVKLKIKFNPTSYIDDLTPCFAVSLCMDVDDPSHSTRKYSDEQLTEYKDKIRDFILTKHFYHKRTIRICNILNKNGEKDIIFQDEPPFGSRWTQDWLRWRYFEPKLVPHYLLEREAGFLQAQDELQIQVIFEPLFPLVKFYMSNNGILNWTLSDYTFKRQAEKDGLVECSYSPYFYSESHGYRMQVRVYLNGAGIAKGTMVSVFLDFLVGEWDDRLPPTLDSFPHQTTVTICDQTEVVSAEKKSLTRSEISRDGCVSDLWYDFAKQSDIREDIHLKNNELLIRVEVKALD